MFRRLRLFQIRLLVAMLMILTLCSYCWTQVPPNPMSVDCNNDCRLIQSYCKMDAKDCGFGTGSRCWKLEMKGPDDIVVSCWSCRKGVEANVDGWCAGGDATLECKDTQQTIKRRRYMTCFIACTQKNAWVEVTPAPSKQAMTNTTEDQNRWLCQLKGS